MFIPSWLVLVLGFVLGLMIALGISMIAPTITGARRLARIRLPRLAAGCRGEKSACI